VLESFSSDITPQRIIIVLLVALVLGLYVFVIYRLAVNNEFYYKDFNRTLVLMAVVTAGIVLAIQSNLVISLGMVGALSIVRFRTAIKSSIDLFFLFWAISIGIICGAGLYLLALMLSIIVTVGLFVTNIMASPIGLGLLVMNCATIEDADSAVEALRPAVKFLRLKNKMISAGNVEVVLEYKTADESGLEKILSQNEKVNRFSIMNYDRETRI
ncbi:MAG: DUF4956 domain-containing protein, partial [Lachnospiraceae bacterium]|nr:DUF4956 domain-containing protein [Lachnospiraceae bacterium]